MNKIAVYLILWSLTTLKAQELYVSIPDSNFRNALKHQGISFKEDSVSLTEASYYKELNISNSQIEDLTGIEAFQNLNILKCYENKLTHLDLTKLKFLNELYCGQNQLQTLHIEGLIKLEHFFCNYNRLKSIDLSSNINLVTVVCSYNQLETIDLPNHKKLRELHCDNNKISKLQLKGLISLSNLKCYQNLLQELDLTGLSKLTWVYCNNNQLTTINASNLPRFQELIANDNPLLSIHLNGSTEMLFLELLNTQLTFVDLRNLSKLERAWLYYTPSLQYVCVSDMDYVLQQQSIGNFLIDVTATWSTDCNIVTAVSDPLLSQPYVVGAYNLQGQQIESEQSNGPIILQYSDGSRQKVLTHNFK